MRGAILVLALCCVACPRSEQKGLRVGYFPNITHGQALVGTSDGTFQRALGDLPFEAKVFNAGPAAMEALLSGAIDVSYVGPGPAINAFLKSKGDLQIIAAAANGGAGLVTKEAQSPEALRGKKIAVPQRGNTQDIALRYWLGKNGLVPDKDVQVVAIPNPEIVALFERGEIEGAWIPEPWTARLLAMGGRLLVDERTLWPNGRFHTTVLVARKSALLNKREALLRLLRAHVDLTRRWQSDAAVFSAAANEGFRKVTGKAVPDEILRDAFSRLEPGLEPDLAQLRAAAEHAKAVGYAEQADVTGLVDTTLLNSVLGENKSGTGASAPAR